MLEPWNDSSIEPPPVHTFKSDGSLDVQGITYICNKITKVLSNQSPLHREAALCSRIIYMYDKKFRNDIGYRIFRKVNVALKRYLKINLLKDVEYFSSALPTSDDLYVPSRQMLEYLLVRIITFSKLMLRICVCSKQASIFYLDRIKRGQNHWMSLIPYATLSRIWSMCVVLLRHSCTWYVSLHQYVNKLMLKGVSFLPNGYNLPADFDTWLGMEDIEDFGKFKWTQKKNQFIGVADEDDDIGNILEYVSQLNDEDEQDSQEEETTTKIPIEISKQEFITPPQKSVDYGVAISRDFLKNMTKSVEKNEHFVHKVTDKESLKLFMNKEEEFRNSSDSRSLTSHLTFMQWQALKSSLQKLYDSLAKSRKIERKFNKLWQEKCLDYIT